LLFPIGHSGICWRLLFPVGQPCTADPGGGGDGVGSGVVKEFSLQAAFLHRGIQFHKTHVHISFSRVIRLIMWLAALTEPGVCVDAPLASRYDLCDLTHINGLTRYTAPCGRHCLRTSIQIKDRFLQILFFLKYLSQHFQQILRVNGVTR
jgi:hypothetical protein